MEKAGELVSHLLLHLLCQARNVFTLDLVGAEGMASKSAKLMTFGAQILGYLGPFNGIVSPPRRPNRASQPVIGSGVREIE